MSPFLTLAYLYDRDRKEHASWRPYLSAWAEFLMRDLPRTEEGGFQHITYNSVNEGEPLQHLLLPTRLMWSQVNCGTTP